MDFESQMQGGSEVLSQSEVERLLAQVAEQESCVTVHKDGNDSVQQSKDSIQPYDFRHPVFLSAGELRKLRLRHEDFIRALAARLSIYLRLEFTLQMSKLQTITYQKFIESLASPTHLTLFKIEPLRGVCILEINPRLGMTMVDRLMGGPGHSVEVNHDPTEIEIALLNQAVQVILGEWSNHWQKVQELRPVLLGYENNGRFVQTAPHDTIMLALTMEARLGDCMEQIQIGFPYYTLEPLIRQLGQTVENSIHEAAQKNAPATRWNAVYDELQVPLTAEWQGLEMTARELCNLKVGDVLQLEPQLSEQVHIRVDEIPKFRGKLGTSGKKWAVEISQVLKSIK
ncbi:MAG: flagellar motor switch protein FliM [Verrucomicrobiales bacterium]|nr:flagellar motor switch protein FliM [Verrucomicrobiales bacterium]